MNDSEKPNSTQMLEIKLGRISQFNNESKNNHFFLNFLDAFKLNVIRN